MKPTSDDNNLDRIFIAAIVAIFALYLTWMYQPFNQNKRIDHLQQSVDKLQHTIDSINNRK